MEQLELGRLPRAEELNVFHHQQVAAAAEALLEAVHLLVANGGRELVGERFSGCVDDPVRRSCARVGGGAGEVGLAEPGLGREIEGIDGLLGSPLIEAGASGLALSIDREDFGFAVSVDPASLEPRSE